MQPRALRTRVDHVSDLVIIFRAHSDIEASVVRGLLEAHGIPSVDGLATCRIPSFR